jgi:predicted  nucleic acid-binding Zn-ribbon protein
LDRSIQDGITSCENCGRVFDDSPKHRLLSATWSCRKNHILYAEDVKDIYGLEDAQVAIVQTFIDRSYSQDEVFRFLTAK